MKYVGEGALSKVIELIRTAINQKGDKSTCYTFSIPATAASYTIDAAGGYKVGVSVSGIALSGYSYFVSPAPTDKAAYAEIGAYMCEPDTLDTVTMHVERVPSAAITIYVMKVQVSS